MPKEEFFSKYMHVDDDVELPTVAKDHFKGVPKGCKEVEMYEPLIQLIQDANLGGSFDFINTSAYADPNSLPYKKFQPVISTHSKEGDGDGDSDEDKKTVFWRPQLPFELKTGKLSPFSDPSKDSTAEERLRHPFENPSESARDLRGQMATTLAEMCARQFRTHAFMVFMNETEVRFLRTDRTATVVTKAYNYRTNSDVLAEFLARFSHITDAQRGMDESVRSATSEEIEVAQAYLRHYQQTPRRFLPWVAIQVPTLDGSVREVIAREPLSEPDSLTGRSTRAFPVYDLKEKKVMFLKDTWRADLPGMDQETDLLRLLNEAGVQHVPKLVDGGDVVGVGEYHTTHSHLSENATWRAGPLAELVPRAHHRFLEDFMGIELKRFKNPRELIQGVADAFEAHRQALYKCGILHRDVSVKNVMLDRGGRGVLNDWDMAKKVGIPGEPLPPAPPETPKRHCYRTGTWYFMAAGLLGDPLKFHTLQDDIESFFWVVFYYSLHFLPNSLSDARIEAIIKIVFQQSIYDPELRQFTGGEGKLKLIMSRKYIQDLEFPGNAPLSQWFDDALQYLDEYYRWEDERSRNERLCKAAAAKGTTAKLPALPPFESLALADHSSFQLLFESALAKPDWPTTRIGVLPASPSARGTRNASKRGTQDDLPETPSKRPRASGVQFKTFAKSIP
ncbi:unnamed protein product [Cyclocybe aegerita]|uniref:Fungal-type protein kinase domain-containing protein n=1 Tax=Cyclocybe aegerita TaxID=1973307 RepID=A0A8S0VZS3_CYCAE|nr:unnamed protein product [Cyclocybe aegerita]